MACFTDYIGIKGACTETTPSSGYYINDIGLNLSEVANYISKEDESAEEFINDKIDFAIKLVKQNIFTNLQNKIKSKTILEGATIGEVQDDMVVVAAEANTYKGISVELNNPNSFVGFYVNQISLFVNYTGDVSVKVYDMMQNKLIETITVACTANQISTVDISKFYTNNRKKQQLAFVYESTGTPSYQTNITGTKPCVGCGVKWEYRNSYINARGITIGTSENIVMGNTLSTGETGGMQLHYSLQCDYEMWFCSIKNLMAIPILYKAGEEIINAGINNYQRVNNKNIHLDLLKERRTEYEAKYNESFKNLLDNMNIPIDSDCFYCNKNLINKIVLP